MDSFLLAVHSWMSGGLLLAGMGCFIWGMISVALSPCHMASIPLIVGYVAGQEIAVKQRHAVVYSMLFTLGLFITIAAVGVACVALGRMLGDIGPYWTILVGLLLIWFSLDMLGVAKCSLSGGLMGRLKVKGYHGAFVLGLAYGVLSGSCTFGFISPILAIISVQGKWATGMLYIVLFGLGHSIPIAVAGSSTALVSKILSRQEFLHFGGLFRRLAGGLVGLLGLYFIAQPFLFA